jgi:hypothetical protein
MTVGFRPNCAGLWIQNLLKKGQPFNSVWNMQKRLDTLTTPRMTFAELAEIDDVAELSCLAERDIADLCEQFPSAMATAITDLLILAIKAGKIAEDERAA